MPKTELIIPLDFKNPTEAWEFIFSVGTQPVIYKVGLELFMNGGPEFVHHLVGKQYRVFLDLKLHDIPNTVAKAAAQASRLGVEMFTLHLAGGEEMVKAVVQEFQTLKDVKQLPRILGVTVLTSFSEEGWSQVVTASAPSAYSIEKSVQGLVTQGLRWGVGGVVCSAHELLGLKPLFPDLYTVVPGIRLDASQKHDQARVMTPLEAKKLGASAIVVGRAITQSVDPKVTVTQILKDLS